jgi:hypothetical protein
MFQSPSRMSIFLMGGSLQMTKILIRCRNIHIGDIIFSSSVARKLKQVTPNCVIHYDVNYLQPIELLNNNPYVDWVYYKESADIDYDIVYQLMNEDVSTLNPYESAVSQFQRMCDIENFDDTFEVFTNQQLDYSIQRSMEELVNIGDWDDDLVKVGYQADWDRKSFLFTEEEYYRAEGGECGGGYGSGSRNVFDIINCMETSPKVMLFALGIDEKISNNYPCLNSTSKFTFTASLMKNCDYVIGAEGCLTNISSALGTKTIITTDYIHQMFGPKGIGWQQSGGDLNNLEDRKPYLGPNSYFPDQGHIELSPFLTDNQVGEEILRIVLNGN